MDTQQSGALEAEVEEMVQKLMGIMEREIDGVTVSGDDRGADSIARLNLDSLALIGFLVAVEDELGIEWDADVDVDVLRSFDAMAAYVLGNAGADPG